MLRNDEDEDLIDEDISERITKSFEDIIETDDSIVGVHFLAICCKEGHIHTGCHTHFDDKKGHDCYGDIEGVKYLHTVIRNANIYHQLKMRFPELLEDLVEEDEPSEPSTI